MVKGTVFRYGDNVDTDVIIPARYLNAPSPEELARGDMNGDGTLAIDDIMAICRVLASYNLQQQ